MKKFGLVGKTLTYSYSQIIHQFLLSKYQIDGTYDLIEVDAIEPALLEQYDGLNITIPYKETIIPFLTENHSPIGACNTIIKKGASLIGYNTDIIGFDLLVKKIDLSTIEDVVILGGGASAKMVSNYFEGKNITIISRRDAHYNYDLLPTLKADILVNTTPIGMNTYESIVDEKTIRNFNAVIDINYNPMNSKMLALAKQQDIKCINGLYMLIMQAIKAFEIWNDIIIDEAVIEEVYQHICFKTVKNIALIGMPLSGKSTMIKKFNGLDLDDEIVKRTGQAISDLLENGTFRTYETTVLKELATQKQPLIALGGGAILKPENIEALKDYLIIFLNTELDVLMSRSEQSERPLIKQKSDLLKLYNERLPLYNRYCNLKMTEEELEGKLNEINGN